MAAKVLSPFDVSSYSRVKDYHIAPSTASVREIGPLESDSALSLTNSGAKMISPFDLSSYSPVINRAGTLSLAKDARGNALVTQRDYGALEYISSLSITSSTKQCSIFDISQYSILWNMVFVSYFFPYVPTTRDARAVTVKSNVRSAPRNFTDFPRFVTTKDLRGATSSLSGREMGGLEYDSTLRITSGAPTISPEGL